MKDGDKDHLLEFEYIRSSIDPIFFLAIQDRNFSFFFVYGRIDFDRAFEVSREHDDVRTYYTNYMYKIFR